MLNTPESNVQFDSEQTRQIEIWKQRVAGLTEAAAEIEGANKVAREETRRIEKHNVYLEGLSLPLEQKIAALTTQKETLEQSIETSMQQLASNAGALTQRESAVAAKEQELNEREGLINSREVELSNKESVHVEKVIVVEEKRRIANEMHTTLMEAVEKVKSL